MPITESISKPQRTMDAVSVVIISLDPSVDHICPGVDLHPLCNQSRAGVFGLCYESFEGRGESTFVCWFGFSCRSSFISSRNPSELKKFRTSLVWTSNIERHVFVRSILVCSGYVFELFVFSQVS